MKSAPKYSFLLLVVSYWLLVLPTLAQIAVNNSAPYNTATYLVQNVLLGQGVTASNITAIGQPQQRGFFNGMNSNIGMDSGFVMSSGDIRELVPFQTGTNPSVQTTIPANYVTDLTRVANSAYKMLGLSYSISGIYDMYVIEFDFIPICDSFKFNYVFSSDEYLTYVNTQYNDVFAFFLYGPGITSTDNENNSTLALGADSVPDFSSYTIDSSVYYPKNIATVPNTNPGQPITISSVNPGSYSQYYINNPSNTTVASNGFTTVLTASSAVQPGQKYHIRLMVSDASDGILNTDVFLEGGTFTSSSAEVDFTTTTTNICGDYCSGSVAISISDSSASFLWNNGATDSVLNNLCEGQYIVTITSPNICPAIVEVVNITVHDAPQIFKQDIVCYGNCDGSAAVYFPYNAMFQWSDGQTDSIATGLCAGQYIVTISAFDSACILTDSVDIFSLNTELMVNITVNTDSGNNSGEAYAFIYGGIPPYVYLWSDSLNQTTDLATGLPAGIYYLTVTDSVGCQKTDSAIVLSVGKEEFFSSINSFQIYPNPNEGKFILQMHNYEFMKCELWIYNLLGEVIYKSANELINKSTIDISFQPDGIYFLKIIFENGQSDCLKFAKNK